MSTQFLRQCLAVAAVVVGVSLIPVTLIFGYVGYYALVPRYSAVAELWDQYRFNVRLDLFRTDETRDSGRYLTVIEETGYYRFMIEGTDWAHRARTSLYRIDVNHLAVLSALGHDYTITLKPWTLAPAEPEGAEQWQYLGAFDFVFPPGHKPWLTFLDASAPECIPMGMTNPSAWLDRPRARARAASCLSPATP